MNKIIGTIAGIVNGIVIAIIDFLYSFLATWFVKLENHKYRDSYETSYVFKLFIFKFINTNLSIFYTAFVYQNF